jgi:hypothetical protein
VEAAIWRWIQASGIWQKFLFRLELEFVSLKEVADSQPATVAA